MSSPKRMMLGLIITEREDIKGVEYTDREKDRTCTGILNAPSNSFLVTAFLAESIYKDLQAFNVSGDIWIKSGIFVQSNSNRISLSKEIS